MSNLMQKLAAIRYKATGLHNPMEFLRGANPHLAESELASAVDRLQSLAGMRVNPVTRAPRAALQPQGTLHRAVQFFDPAAELAASNPHLSAEHAQQAYDDLVALRNMGLKRPV